MSAPEPTEDTLPERFTYQHRSCDRAIIEERFDDACAGCQRGVGQTGEAFGIGTVLKGASGNVNLDDLTDNERTILAAIAQREASSWVFPGTSVPISYPERGRRALRWLEIAAMFNADYTPQEWVVETATAWAARKDDHES